jgi:hypothetical protein
VLDNLKAAVDNCQKRRHEEVSTLAYFKWQEAGCPEGRDHDFWVEAEQEWSHKNGLTGSFLYQNAPELPAELKVTFSEALSINLCSPIVVEPLATGIVIDKIELPPIIFGDAPVIVEECKPKCEEGGCKKKRKKGEEGEGIEGKGTKQLPPPLPLPENRDSWIARFWKRVSKILAWWSR